MKRVSHCTAAEDESAQGLSSSLVDLLFKQLPSATEFNNLSLIFVIVGNLL
jgi:hypothetical protein